MWKSPNLGKHEAWCFLGRLPLHLAFTGKVQSSTSELDNSDSSFFPGSMAEIRKILRMKSNELIPSIHPCGQGVRPHNAIHLLLASSEGDRGSAREMGQSFRAGVVRPFTRSLPDVGCR